MAQPCQLVKSFPLKRAVNPLGGLGSSARVPAPVTASMHIRGRRANRMERSFERGLDLGERRSPRPKGRVYTLRGKPAKAGSITISLSPVYGAFRGASRPVL